MIFLFSPCHWHLPLNHWSISVLHTFSASVCNIAADMFNIVARLWMSWYTFHNMTRLMKFARCEHRQSYMLHRVYVNYTILIGTREILLYRFKPYSPNEDTIGPDRDTLGRQPSAILSRLGDTFIPIQTLFFQWGYNRPRSGYPWLTTPSAILSRLGY